MNTNRRAWVRARHKAFAQVQWQNLEANMHKGGWSHDTPSSLFTRLLEEVEELRAALMDRESPSSVAKEAADVANFAMMLADVAGDLAERTEEEAKRCDEAVFEAGVAKGEAQERARIVKWMRARARHVDWSEARALLETEAGYLEGWAAVQRK